MFERRKIGSMIHKFIFDDLRIILDVGSGSVHVVDALAWEAIALKEEGFSWEKIEDRLKKKYLPEEIKAFWSEFTMLLEKGLLFSKEKEPIDPFYSYEPVVKALCLHVAHACNLSCRYCFAGQGKFSGEEALMSKETGYAAVDFLLAKSAHRKNVEIDFFGGEPLLNFQVIKAITEYGEKQALIKGKKIKFTLTTNGVLLEGEVADYFQKKKFSVVLSLDGRREINDFMRPFYNGRGSFSKVYPNLLTFVRDRNQRDYFIRGTYTRGNLDFSKDVEFLLEKGFKHISLEPVIGDPADSYTLKEEDIPFLMQEYEKLTRLYLQKKVAGDPFTFFHFNIDLEGGPCLNKRIKGCGAGTEYLAVTPTGDLYPCHQFVDKDTFKIGRLGGELNQNIVELFAGANIYSKKDCLTCWAKFYCGGGCHAASYNFYGDIKRSDKMTCLLEKKKIECALYIKAKELEAGSERLEVGRGGRGSVK